MPPLPSFAAAEPTPARVLIVDDSAVARAILARAIDEDRRFAVSATHAGVAGALAFLDRNTVDVILLDLEMPEIDGLTALPDLLRASDGAKVLVVSSACAEGAIAGVQALALGAADTLVKPATGALAGRFGFAETLRAKLTALTATAPSPRGAAPSPRPHKRDYGIVAIGASTGGIHALGQLLRALPERFDVPILVTQHLPLSFTPYFAAQVAVLANRPCDVATDRLRLRPRRIIIAPGDAHVVCVALADGGAAVRLLRDRVANGCMPSVDPMLASVAAVFGARGAAVVLSGMGRDGAEGARAVRERGGTVIVQDEASSVVWGMPGAVANAGHADHVLAPEAIGRMIAGFGNAP